MEILLVLYLISCIVTGVGVYQHITEDDWDRIPLKLWEYVGYSLIVFFPITNTFFAIMQLLDRDEKGG